MDKSRPKYLALHQIHLPLPGWVSILHRISGALLFLALPFLLWMFWCSLHSINTYTQLAGALRHPLSKIFLLLILWSFLQHFCAGIRYLMIDLDIGAGLAQARASSRWVLAVSLALTVLLGVRLW
jgi:succinate dehydrogenase / fumarate reductase cytochrome b subunit